MTKKSYFFTFLVITILLISNITECHAKVIFTGYGDIEFALQNEFESKYKPQVQADKKEENQQFELSTMGFFTNVSIGESSSFYADMSYNTIGYEVGSLRLQYAYYEHEDENNNTKFKAGKIIVPIGLFNTKKYYAFQRLTIASPNFNTLIFGLPWSDHGASFSKTFKRKKSNINLTVFGINGFKNIDNPKDATGTIERNEANGSDVIMLTQPTINHSDWLVGWAKTTSNEKNNDKLGLGTTFKIDNKKGFEISYSYYSQKWDPAGVRPFRLSNAYLTKKTEKTEIIYEYQNCKIGQDTGVDFVFGTADWETKTSLFEINHKITPKNKKPFYLIVNLEKNVIEGDPTNGTEATIDRWTFGYARKLDENSTLKLEYYDQDIIMPVTAGSIATLNALMAAQTGVAGATHPAIEMNTTRKQIRLGLTLNF